LRGLAVDGFTELKRILKKKKTFFWEGGGGGVRGVGRMKRDRACGLRNIRSTFRLIRCLVRPGSKKRLNVRTGEVIGQST